MTGTQSRFVETYPKGAAAVINSTVDRTRPAMSIFPFPNSRSHPNPPVSPSSSATPSLAAAVASPILAADGHAPLLDASLSGLHAPCMTCNLALRNSRAHVNLAGDQSRRKPTAGESLFARCGCALEDGGTKPAMALETCCFGQRAESFKAAPSNLVSISASALRLPEHWRKSSAAFMKAATLDLLDPVPCPVLRRAAELGCVDCCPPRIIPEN